jgi:hypothetical protein
LPQTLQNAGGPIAWVAKNTTKYGGPYRQDAKSTVNYPGAYSLDAKSTVSFPGAYRLDAKSTVNYPGAYSLDVKKNETWKIEPKSDPKINPKVLLGEPGPENARNEHIFCLESLFPERLPEACKMEPQSEVAKNTIKYGGPYSLGCQKHHKIRGTL